MDCQLADITVHYESIGEGRPMIMLHGATLDYRHMWNDMEPAFATRQGWRRIYLDLPGHGRTPAPDWIRTNDDVLQVVLDFIDCVIPGQRFTLVGTSWGGMLSRAILSKNLERVDGICLIVTPMIRRHERPEEIRLVEDPQLVAEADAIDLRASEMMRRQPIQTREVLEWWLTNSLPAKDLLDMNFRDRF